MRMSFATCTSSQKHGRPAPQAGRFLFGTYEAGWGARRSRIRTASMRFSRTDSTRIE